MSEGLDDDYIVGRVLFCSETKKQVCLSCNGASMENMVKRLFFVLLIAVMAGTAWAWPGKVIGVSDGDTITVLRQGNKQVKIRLYGIDAPESSQPHGKASKANLSGMVFGKVVEIEPTDTDRYGRTVGRVIVGGVDANAKQIEAGYAWLYRQYCKGSRCSDWAALESRAKASRSGLWADKSPMPPWEWRRGRQSFGNSEPVSGKTGQAVSGAYSGNTESHIFHRPGCKHYKCKNCSVSFPTRDAAIAAGYRPCGFCKP